MADQMKLKKIPVREPKKDEKFMVEDDKPSIFPPSFDADNKQMPEIQDWDVDGTYRLVIDVEMKSKRSDKRGSHAGFNIVAYKHIPKKKIENMTDEEFGKEQSRALSEAARS